MRTQKELKEYYRLTDFFYKGENPPSGWRFVDPEKEKIPYDHLNSCDGKWFSLESDDDLKYSVKDKWVLITDLPLPNFAPENQGQTIQSDQTSKSKQAEQNNQTIQTQTNQLMKERKYIVNYGPVNYEVPETTLKEIFKPDEDKCLRSFKSSFEIVREFLKNGELSSKEREIKVWGLESSAWLATSDAKRYFHFPPLYIRTIKFVYRKNRDEINWRTLGVTEETDTYLCGIDLADNQFKKFLKEKILGGEILEINQEN